MPERLDYTNLTAGIQSLREIGHALATESSLEPELLELVRVLVSRCNGCQRCTHLHEAELRKLHEPQERIDGVLHWRSSGQEGEDARYTQRERAALAWGEAVTNIQDASLRESAQIVVREHFTDAEIASLTLAIAIINVWNRMEIAMAAFSPQNGATA